VAHHPAFGWYTNSSVKRATNLAEPARGSIRSSTSGPLTTQRTSVYWWKESPVGNL